MNEKKQELAIKIGRNIRQIREELGYKTVRSFAVTIGVYPSRLYRIEKGTVLISTFEIYQIICQTKVKPERIFRGAFPGEH